eukprot:UN25010
MEAREKKRFLSELKNVYHPQLQHSKPNSTGYHNHRKEHQKANEDRKPCRVKAVLTTELIEKEFERVKTDKFASICNCFEPNAAGYIAGRAAELPREKIGQILQLANSIHCIPNGLSLLDTAVRHEAKETNCHPCDAKYFRDFSHELTIEQLISLPTDYQDNDYFYEILFTKMTALPDDKDMTRLKVLRNFHEYLKNNKNNIRITAHKYGYIQANVVQQILQLQFKVEGKIHFGDFMGYLHLRYRSVTSLSKTYEKQDRIPEDCLKFPILQFENIDGWFTKMVEYFVKLSFTKSLDLNKLGSFLDKEAFENIKNTQTLLSGSDDGTVYTKLENVGVDLEQLEEQVKLQFCQHNKKNFKVK